MAEPYAVPVYGSPEYFQHISDVYRQGAQPDVERGTAQLKNLLGGRGTYYGSPLANRYLQQVEKPYATGLSNVMGNEISGLSKFQAQKPFEEAGLTGYYGGSPTLARTQWENLSPYQEESIDILKQNQEAEALRNLVNAFGGIEGITDLFMKMIGKKGW